MLRPDGSHLPNPGEPSRLLSAGIGGREGLVDVTVWPPAGFEGGSPGRVLNIRLAGEIIPIT
jgi:hypothetical protein